ncbi:MAG: hypothetical protein AVW05_03150 [Hadesarchaea archaeon DG-33]|nr:MAG: hypothetical protein AVW05_03150 [Hadesarchaea archaeon DG-33]
MKNRLQFLSIFLSVGFIMKILGEVIHEVIGHGFFVLLFGGTITRVHIALLWPYELSSIRFSPPANGFEPSQLAWIAGGGILICLIISYLLQLFLLFRKSSWPISISLFWLAFWTFINPVGYLIMGGIKPFGDVANLINRGILTQEIVLALGLFLFLLGFFSLSRILGESLIKTRVIKKVKNGIVLFWFIIPFITLVNLIGYGQPWISFPISFIPVLLAYAYTPLKDRLFKRLK